MKNEKEGDFMKKGVFAVIAAVLVTALLLCAACKNDKKDGKSADKTTTAPAQATTDLGDRVESKMDDVSEGLSSAGERVSEGLSDAGEKVREGVSDVSERVSEGVSDANETLSSVAQDLRP
jgi:hypothetical protein